MKYVIEINDHPMNDSCTPALYRAKNFKTLVFDEYGLKKLQPFDEAVNIQEGLAWNKGYNVGHMNIKQESYDKGYDEGFDAGVESGRDKGYIDGFENGEREGYEKAHAECVGKSTRNYNDGYSEGLEDGFKDGKTEGEEELKGIVLDFIKNIVIGRTESKYKPEVAIFDACNDCRYAHKEAYEMPCVDCKHSHKDMYERG